MVKFHRSEADKAKRSIAMKKRWAEHPELRAAMLNAAHTPEAWAKAAKTNQERILKDPERRAAQVKRMTAMGRDPARIEALRRSWADPEMRARRLKGIRDYQTPEVRSQIAHESWSNPEVRAKFIAARNDPAAKAAVSATTKAHWADPAKRAAHIATYNSPEVRAKKSAALRRAFADPATKERQRAGVRKQWTPERKAPRVAAFRKRLDEDPAYREWRIGRSIAGLCKRPTSLEKEMMALIEKHHLPLRYVGDGALIIGYKNPDFVHTNGRKIAVEVANTIHHKPDYPVTRPAYFARFGWECVVLMGNHLDENAALARLREAGIVPETDSEPAVVRPEGIVS